MKPRSSESGFGADLLTHDVDRSSAVYGRLRELIVRGRLPAGTRIIESEVAARLEVSRTPVRIRERGRG